MDGRDLREALLGLETASPALRAEYERKKQAMVQRELTPGQRVGWVLSTLLSLGFFIGFGYLAVAVPAELPWQARAGFAAGSLFGLGFAILGITILRAGRMDRRKHATAAAGLAWGVVLISFIFASQLAAGAQESYRALSSLVTALGFLLLGAVFLLRNVIEQASLKTEEQILRLQIQVADLSEKLGHTS